jgi:hypothetical protein
MHPSSRPSIPCGRAGHQSADLQPAPLNPSSSRGLPLAMMPKFPKYTIRSRAIILNNFHRSSRRGCAATFGVSIQTTGDARLDTLGSEDLRCP